MTKEKPLYEYDIKVLLALVKALQGNKDFFKFLIENGYIELAAFCNAIRGDVEALKFLMIEGYPTLGILSNAFDEEPDAMEWIARKGDIFLIKFSAACRKDNDALKWFKDQQAQIFVYMITEIRTVLKQQLKDSIFVWYKWH